MIRHPRQDLRCRETRRRGRYSGRWRRSSGITSSTAGWSIASHGLLVRDTGDWVLVGHPALLDMGCLLITGFHIEALHGEHQHELMVLMVLSLSIVCRQYAATELAELEFWMCLGARRGNLCRTCARSSSQMAMCSL